MAVEVPMLLSVALLFPVVQLSDVAHVTLVGTLVGVKIALPIAVAQLVVVLRLSVRSVLADVALLAPRKRQTQKRARRRSRSRALRREGSHSRQVAIEEKPWS